MHQGNFSEVCLVILYEICQIKWQSTYRSEVYHCSHQRPWSSSSKKPDEPHLSTEAFLKFPLERALRDTWRPHETSFCRPSLSERLSWSGVGSVQGCVGFSSCSSWLRSRGWERAKYFWPRAWTRRRALGSCQSRNSFRKVWRSGPEAETGKVFRCIGLPKKGSVLWKQSTAQPTIW